MSGRFARECARAGVRDSRQCRQSPSTQRLRVVTESIWRFVGSIWWSSWISRFEQDVCRYHISLALLHITFDILLEARGSGSKGSSTAACITFVSHGSGSGQWDFRLVADLSTFLPPPSGQCSSHASSLATSNLDFRPPSSSVLHHEQGIHMTRQ